jgi:uracil phosphoribosyltransferase
MGSIPPELTAEDPMEDLSLGGKFKVLPSTDQIKELQTIIRDKATSRSDFKFVADRLIRMVIEEGLNQLPYTSCEVTTPTGCSYSGLRYEKGNCGVSIVRSGEAMEKALQDCCRSMRIGKILVDSDSETHEARVVFAKLPDDISSRKVLLLYPIMSSGNKVVKAVKVLKDHDVPEDHIIFINLFCTPTAARRIVSEYPNLTILTTELNPVTPNHFGQRYFGTDHVD